MKRAEIEAIVNKQNWSYDLNDIEEFRNALRFLLEQTRWRKCAEPSGGEQVLVRDNEGRVFLWDYLPQPCPIYVARWLPIQPPEEE